MTPKQIKKLRQELGWSAWKLGKEVGVSPRTVEGWEQGRPISKLALKILKQIKNDTKR